WTWNDDAALVTRRGHVYAVKALAQAADGALLSADDRGNVHRWRGQENQDYQTIYEHPMGVCDLQFSPDSDLLASMSWDGTVKVWDLKTGKIRFTIKEGMAGPWHIAFHPRQ